MSRITINSKKSDYSLVIYFAPHVNEYPEPILAQEFRTEFEKCRVFIMEDVEQWMKHYQEKESLYNKLSAGLVASVPAKDPRGYKAQLTRFARELQQIIRGSRKKIVLEKSPVIGVDIFISEYLDVRVHRGFDQAFEWYVAQHKALAESMIERDRALVAEVIQRELTPGSTVFVFRGAAHERYLSRLLQEKAISACCIRYEAPPLNERVMGSLMIGEEVPVADWIRLLYVDLNKQGTYQDFLRLLKDAEEMTEQELRTKLA